MQAPPPPSLVEFYRLHGISPVRQDIADLAGHFSRRDSLYRFLGIPPAFVAGLNVVEFGPGSGHNALFTASLQPAHYTLVDGNPRGVEETRALLETHGFLSPNIEIVQSDFETYRNAGRQFDLVLAEGCLNFQADPVALLQKIASVTRPGGVLVVTAVTPVSIVAELTRRLIRDSLVASDAPPEVQLPILRPVFGTHLAALPGVTRPLDDWLLDQIVKPIWNTRTLAFPDILNALGDDFEVHGGSPRFSTDFRWYKRLDGPERGFNALALACYRARLAALLDYRFEPEVMPPPRSAALDTACEALWRHTCMVEGPEQAPVAPAGDLLVQIASLVEGILPVTADALREGAGVLLGRHDPHRLTLFPALWGRGQQYVSLIRRSSSPLMATPTVSSAPMAGQDH